MITVIIVSAILGLPQLLPLANAQPPASPEKGAKANPHGNPHGGMGAAQDAGDLASIKVKKAEGAEGRTVAEVYAEKAALKGKKVVVRGKVVKFSANIMGKNWLHLRDGSGSAAEKNFDLTVSSKDNAKVGEVVVVTGTLAADKDLGAGYFYPVLLEEAKITK